MKTLDLFFLSIAFSVFLSVAFLVLFLLVMSLFSLSLFSHVSFTHVSLFSLMSFSSCLSLMSFSHVSFLIDPMSLSILLLSMSSLHFGGPLETFSFFCFVPCVSSCCSLTGFLVKFLFCFVCCLFCCWLLFCVSCSCCVKIYGLGVGCWSLGAVLCCVKNFHGWIISLSVLVGTLYLWKVLCLGWKCCGFLLAFVVP